MNLINTIIIAMIAALTPYLAYEIYKAFNPKYECIWSDCEGPFGPCLEHRAIMNTWEETDSIVKITQNNNRFFMKSECKGLNK